MKSISFTAADFRDLSGLSPARETYDAMVAQMSRAYWAAEDARIREAIINHLGYLPTFSDIRKHGMRQIAHSSFGSGVKLFWMGKEIASW